MVGDLVCMGSECIVPIRVAQLATCALLAILFLQSSSDKILDWQGNIGWISEHFSETPLAGFIKPLLAVLTLFELSTGLACAIGAAVLWFTGAPEIALLGVTLAAFTLLQLFAGQRIAKDYGGASELMPYFLTALIGLLLLT